MGEVIPELEDAIDMELGAEEDYDDVGKTPDRIRLLLAFVGEAVGIIGGFILYLSYLLEIPEGIVAGIVLILGTLFFCLVPIIALELKKYQYAAELSALDSQTQMQDYDWWEQIDVEDVELVMLPQFTLTGDQIAWNEELIEASIAVLKQVVQRVGGRSYLHPTIMDGLVDARLKELVANRQELNPIQRLFCWLFRIKPQLIPTDFKKLADDWVSWNMDQGGIEVSSRIGMFSMHYEEFQDMDGEIAIAPTERFETYRRDEEEDLGFDEGITRAAKAWEIKEIRRHEAEERERKRFHNRVYRRFRNTFRNPYRRDSH